MKSAPPRAGGSAVLYDSVIGYDMSSEYTYNTKDPSIFVVFRDAAAYPEYIITFRNEPGSGSSGQKKSMVDGFKRLVGISLGGAAATSPKGRAADAASTGDAQKKGDDGEDDGGFLGRRPVSVAGLSTDDKTRHASKMARGRVDDSPSASPSALRPAARGLACEHVRCDTTHAGQPGDRWGADRVPALAPDGVP